MPTTTIKDQLAAGAKRHFADVKPEDLDPVIHERCRLFIMSALAKTGALTWNDLKRLYETTDGNLHVHTKKLVAEGYIKQDVTLERRRSGAAVRRSEYRITSFGRRALEQYLRHVALVSAAVLGEKT